MYQSLQSMNNLLLLGSMILLIAIFIPIFIWGMRKTMSDIQKLPEFSDRQVAAVQRQMLALLVGAPLILLFCGVAPLVWDHPTQSIVFIGLVVFFAPIAYIAVSSIKNRVSILRGREPLPVQDAKAIWSGVLNLVFVVLVVAGYAIYFASGK